MKICFSLLLIIALTSQFGTNEIFAQKKSKPREVIIIEFTPPQRNAVKRKILINRNSKTNYETMGGGASGGAAGCGDCSQEEAERINREYKAKLKKFSYAFTAKARRTNNIKSNLSFSISIGDGKCQTEKTFVVYRNQQTKLELDCGISLIAYYGFESKETN